MGASQGRNAVVASPRSDAGVKKEGARMLGKGNAGATRVSDGRVRGPGIGTGRVEALSLIHI
eukprot:2555656-Alexandrium_andersonii.AAC.1